MHHHSKFRPNWSIHYGDIAIFRFFKMAAVRRLGFVWRVFEPPTNGRRTNGLYHCAKFDCDRCSSFNNTKVSIIGAFGLKTPIRPKIRNLGGEYDALNGQQHQRNAKKAHLCTSPCHLSHSTRKSADRSDCIGDFPKRV